MRTLAPILLLVGCSSNGPAPLIDASARDAQADAVQQDGDNANLSGTRIKSVVLKTADGASVFTGLYDSQRQEDCAFRTASDGKTRCLPLSAYPFPGGFYADANCTQPVLQLAVCLTAPRYATRANTVSCSTSTISLYPVGSAVTSVYQQNGGCVLITDTGGSYSYYALGAEVPPSDFVEGVSMVQP